MNHSRQCIKLLSGSLWLVHHCHWVCGIGLKLGSAHWMWGVPLFTVLGWWLSVSAGSLHVLGGSACGAHVYR